MQRLLIIGGVAAGATAAARARRLDNDIEITMLEAGPDVSFANCGLPYYIGGEIESRSKLILQSPESFKAQYNVDVAVQTEVVSIDRARRVVTARHLPSGEERGYPYDSLILAQGGKPLVPNLPGVQADHVFSLWTLADMDAIDAFISERNPRTVAVIGGGFIGVEMVEALSRRGLEVNLVERMPHVMPNLEPEIAGYLTEELLARGVGLHTGRSLTAIEEGRILLDDDSALGADMVLISVGVRPTLSLAQTAGLETGVAGGLLVDEKLRTSDPHIWAAGDMVEIAHRIHGRSVRIPLAGPANRQGRIAATNALGGDLAYRGALGTSVVRLFDAVAGSTGLNRAQAAAAGIEARTVAVHKEHHTSYYPGAEQVTVLVVYDQESGRILGGQSAGVKGADRRLDVLAVAAAAGMSIDELAELDLAYSPPIGTANDAINMAAFAAQNRRSGFSPSLSPAELEEFVAVRRPLLLDLRDYFAHARARVEEALHLPLEQLEAAIPRLPRDRALLLISEDGKKGHQALRRLVQSGFGEVYNLSGGFISLARHARAAGFSSLTLDLPRPEARETETPEKRSAPEQTQTGPELGGSEPIVVDVRTPEEFAFGAFPGAVNIPLDELGPRMEELGEGGREITVYCASGARSAYAQRMLQAAGFSRVQNGGGLSEMMARAN